MDSHPPREHNPHVHPPVVPDVPEAVLDTQEPVEELVEEPELPVEPPVIRARTAKRRR